MKTTLDPQTELIERLRQDLADMRRDFETRLQALETAIAAGEKPAAKAAPKPAPEPVAPVEEPVSEEIIAILGAVITSYLGKKVRVRSARRVYPFGNPWGQQGRAFVQASHNLSR